MLLLQGKETEHNWAIREQAIQRVRGMLKGEVYERYTETFLHGLKNGFLDASLKTVSTILPQPAMSLSLTYNEIIALSAREPPYYRRREHMRVLHRALYRPWHRTGPVLRLTVH